ncbi:PspA-associated protein PspAA [Streptomyces sp. NBC_00887]|uniref:PspA-associated protein PspAA n=1 Tax=Streptomyces sp. NBC_00887 TaxID=2975859 RepID=UPI003870BD2D|nr:hypothetical protein OG844_00855 [Streptomyces sp. NBC_00887]WSY36272.1 hypothetical protein OG844_44740 [Streptomyces sp. NBC_00887]
MIMRILGEGQYDVADEHLDRLNQLDSALQASADAGDETAFTSALSALLDAVRSLGEPVSNERITPSDLVLPEETTSLSRMRELLSDEGLIPG